ncbi:MAG: pyridoxamine 5'-phosphate oxidase family protein [Candidatus Thorarchaeota archaeon]|jgi:hypothetical protein|nr:pyridoxamine 5'-phosphate oxidase family protein [Candidatus Thorarchaeota archaeon]
MVEGTDFRTVASELPENIFTVLHKPNKALSPVSIVATVDPDGAPHTALFGSMRAVTPRLLRFASLRQHDTYVNLLKDDRVMVAFVASPNIAVSIKGRARVAREKMALDENFALLEIDIEEVKNDMIRRVVIDSPITISARDKFKEWFNDLISEMDTL